MSISVQKLILLHVCRHGSINLLISPYFKGTSKRLATQIRLLMCDQLVSALSLASSLNMRMKEKGLSLLW